MKTALFLIAIFLVSQIEAHARWVCPKPRNANTGIKSGPCGPESGNFTGSYMDISPGPMTLVFEESIAHKGAPFRIALSVEGSDDYYHTCVLLNHIPHNDDNAPIYGVESTYTKTYITVEIPNVKCDRCALQLVNPMTDKLEANGQSQCLYDPTCTTCNDGVRCFSNYHSCSNVRINGTIPRSQYVCPSAAPGDWPYGHLPQDIYYPREIGEFSADGQWLANVPSFYATPTGPCV